MLLLFSRTGITQETLYQEIQNYFSSQLTTLASSTHFHVISKIVNRQFFGNGVCYNYTLRRVKQILEEQLCKHQTWTRSSAAGAA